MHPPLRRLAPAPGWFLTLALVLALPPKALAQGAVDFRTRFAGDTAVPVFARSPRPFGADLATGHAWRSAETPSLLSPEPVGSLDAPSSALEGRSASQEARTAPAPKRDEEPPEPAYRNTAKESPSETAGIAPRRTGERPLGRGLATWYEHPGRTASGEAYRPDGLTAAHRTLPFGTKVKVTNAANGRSVVVRINDRYSGPRPLAVDLSRGAARRLGIEGTATVALHLVSQPAP